MSGALIRDLSDCTEFRFALEARPPRIVHGTVLLLVALLGAGVGWLALTKANLVVRAAGRVRPVTTPQRVFTGRGEVLGSSQGGRVVEVNCREGDEVKKGDVLVRLDTERLDNELAKRGRALAVAEEELQRLTLMEGLLTRQYEATKGKTEAELAEAAKGVDQEAGKQGADARAAQAELTVAEDDLRRLRDLRESMAASESELVRAQGQVRAARERLAKARLPVNEGKVEILRETLHVAEKDYDVRRAELIMKRGTKQGEVDAARYDLAALERERAQALLRAPIDGVVTSGDLKVGDVLEAGKPVLEIAAEAGFRFEAAVRSDDVGKLRVGLPVRIKLDPFDYQKYGTVAGTVCYISPDSAVPEGEKAPVFVVKVLVDGDQIGRGDLRGQIKLGMAGQAEIVTDRESLLSVLLRTVRQSISLD